MRFCCGNRCEIETLDATMMSEYEEDCDRVSTFSSVCRQSRYDDRIGLLGEVLSRNASLKQRPLSSQLETESLYLQKYVKQQYQLNRDGDDDNDIESLCTELHPDGKDSCVVAGDDEVKNECRAVDSVEFVVRLGNISLSMVKLREELSRTFTCNETLESSNYVGNNNECYDHANDDDEKSFFVMPSLQSESNRSSINGSSDVSNVSTSSDSSSSASTSSSSANSCTNPNVILVNNNRKNYNGKRKKSYKRGMTPGNNSKSVSSNCASIQNVQKERITSIGEAFQKELSILDFANTKLGDCMDDNKSIHPENYPVRGSGGSYCRGVRSGMISAHFDCKNKISDQRSRQHDLVQLYASWFVLVREILLVVCIMFLIPVGLIYHLAQRHNHL